MSKRFVVVYEAKADFTLATEIADRVLLTEIDWLDETLLEHQRVWIGEESAGRLLTWKSIPSRAHDLGIIIHGPFNGEKGLPDAKAARRAIAYILRQMQNVDAIVLIRDADDQGERLDGLKQARAIFASDCKIVIGVAICERECWVICGFQPINEIESKKLAIETQNLGRNPCTHSHELTAGKDDQAKRSPKRVLKFLMEENFNRERECWQSTSLEILIERGQLNGLAEYLEEIRIHLVPMITGQ